MMQHFNATGDYDRAIASGQHALPLATILEDVALQVGAQQHLGCAYLAIGDYCRAKELLIKNVTSLKGDLLREHLGRAFPPSVASRRYLSMCLAALGEFSEGIVYGEEGLRIAEAIHAPSNIAYASYGIGSLYLTHGEWQRAIATLERGRELCQVADIKFASFLSALVASLGYAYALSGRVAEALTLLEQAVQDVSTRYLGYTLWVAWLAEAYLVASRMEDALSCALRALELSQTHRERGHQAWTLRLLGDIAMHHQPLNFNQAEMDYQQALSLADELGMRPLQAHCHRGLGTLYSQTGQVEQARTELSTAIEMYRDMEMTFWLPETEAALAGVGGKE
jgi:tetratricopeptide (TPR) repeat protein